MAIDATTPQGQVQAAVPARQRIIDTDVHNFPVMSDVLPYMPQRWRRYYENYGLRTGAGEQSIVRARWMGSRTDAWTPDGRPPGSDRGFMTEQLLDAFDVDIAILNNSMGHAHQFVGGGAPVDFTSALMRAGNEWAVERWLDEDSRFLNTMMVPYEDPRAAVAEIERWVDDQRFVQISVPLRTQRPLGHRKYWDLLEACVEHDLPIAFHPGQGNLGPHTATGWPSFYYEDHVNFPHALMGHMASFICEGVFDRWPGLKIVFQEGGWSWISSYSWRFDRAYSQLADEVSHLQRKPSEYVADHFWYTSQPWEEMERPEQFEQALAAFGHSDKLIFASDYPHWDFDPPTDTMGKIADEQLRQDIMCDNALRLYPRIPRTGHLG